MLTIETGAGVTGATSYASAATLDAYALARGLTATGTEAAKESALLRAMSWLEAKAWKGRKVKRDNPLEWPRREVVDRNGYDVQTDIVPAPVVNALCEAALRELASSGSLQPDQGRDSHLSAVKVGEIELSWEAGASAAPSITIINGLLRGLVFADGSVRLARG